jgi:alkylation response protein AidB-like acyl-CoA dehydrogenase
VVPRDCLLGRRDSGWEVVTAGLTFERVGVARYARAGRIIDLLVAHMNETGRAHDPHVRQQLADLRARLEAARLLSYRAISMQAAGEVPTTEASVARIHGTQLEQLVGQVGLELLGASGQLRAGDDGVPLAGEIHRQWLRNIPTTVAAGTLEIQKNIVARRGLGLPR